MFSDLSDMCCTHASETGTVQSGKVLTQNQTSVDSEGLRKSFTLLNPEGELWLQLGQSTSLSVSLC